MEVVFGILCFLVIIASHEIWKKLHPPIIPTYCDKHGCKLTDGNIDLGKWYDSKTGEGFTQRYVARFCPKKHDPFIYGIGYIWNDAPSFNDQFIYRLYGEGRAVSLGMKDCNENRV